MLDVYSSIIVVWSPQYVSEISALEVQRRFTKRLPLLQGPTDYSNRIMKLGLQTLTNGPS